MITPIAQDNARLNTGLSRCRANIAAAAVLSAALLTGCAGAGGLGVSGGSIPPGSISGSLLLPSGQPMTNPTVTIRVLPAAQIAPATATVHADGSFVVTNVPSGKNAEILFTKTGATLRVVIPSAQVVANQTTNIGVVSALSTVVAASLELETTGGDVATTNQIVASQTSPLTNEIAGEDQTEVEEDDEITDQTSLRNTAKSLVVATEDVELSALASNPTSGLASAALDAVIGQIIASGGTPNNLTSSQRSALISTQLANNTYSPATIAAALVSAGASSATSGAVVAANNAQRNTVSAWDDFGQSITPYEALAIAASPKSGSGFALSAPEVGTFLTALGI